MDEPTQTKKPRAFDMQRRIELLQRQLAAEKERADKAWSFYGAALREKVEPQLRIF